MAPRVTRLGVIPRGANLKTMLPSLRLRGSELGAVSYAAELAATSPAAPSLPRRRPLSPLSLSRARSPAAARRPRIRPPLAGRASERRPRTRPALAAPPPPVQGRRLPRCE